MASCDKIRIFSSENPNPDWVFVKKEKKAKPKTLPKTDKITSFQRLMAIFICLRTEISELGQTLEMYAKGEDAFSKKVSKACPPELFNKERNRKFVNTFNSAVINAGYPDPPADKWDQLFQEIIPIIIRYHCWYERIAIEFYHATDQQSLLENIPSRQLMMLGAMK